MSNFPSAAESLTAVRFDVTIYDEIVAIERAVIVAADATLMEATVDDNTTMTNSTPSDATSQSYYNVWKKTETDRVKNDQMNQVIAHFEDKGYTITRQTNGNSADALQWNVQW